MALDPYGPCPCGSGKKLKFCCGALGGEIEKILRMIAGDQPKAALTHIERQLAKHPHQATLLELRAQLEIELGELSRAEKSVAEFRSAAPDSAVPDALSALLEVANDKFDSAVALLQLAMSKVGTDLPRPVWQAMAIVGRALLESGEIFAGVAHLRIYGAFADDEDPNLGILANLQMDRRLPLRLREQPALIRGVEDVSWSDAFEDACDDAERGQWSRAKSRFEKIHEEFGPQPESIYNLALIEGWLGNRAEMARGLHEFAGLEIPRDDAVEAESLAQLVDPQLQERDDLYEAVASTFAVEEEDEFGARLATDKRFRSVPTDEANLGEDQGPPPRSSWLLLDRPLPDSGTEIEVDDVPIVIAGVQVYGKQTDRGAQVVLLSQRPDRRELAENTLREASGDQLGAQVRQDTVGRRSRLDMELEWQPCFPHDTPAPRRRELADQRRQHVLLDQWTDVSSPALGGLAPREAATDEQRQVLVLAAILNLELSLDGMVNRSVFDTLRDKLQIPPDPVVDPELDDVTETSIARLARVDPARLPDDELLETFQRALAYRYVAVILLLGDEIVRRESVHGQVNLLDLYRPLVLFESDHTVATRRLASCRELESQTDANAPASDLLELEYNIVRGDATQLEASMVRFRSQHAGNRDVELAAFQLLMRYGLIDSNAMAAQAAAAPQLDAAAPPREESRIWTPDSETQQQKSAIWTP